MKQDILTHLRSNKPYAGSSLAQFLKTKKADKTQQEVKDALQSLLAEESIEFTGTSPIDAFDGQELHSPISAFQGNFDSVKITWKGERRWEDVQSFILTSNVNKSLIDTNASIRSLNKLQRVMAVVTFLVAGASLVVAITSTNSAKRGDTVVDAQALTRRLDSLKQYERGVDSSLSKMVRDTLHCLRH